MTKAISLAKPVTREMKNFLIEARSFKKKVATETRIATKPVLMEIVVLAMTDMILLKSVVMA